MSLFRNKKRTEFYNDLKKVKFDKIKVDENNFDIKGVLEQIKKEAEKISKAIENWRKNKTHKDTDGYGTYLKSKSQKYLNDIKNACEVIQKIENIKTNNSIKNKISTIDLLLKEILALQSELKSAATAKFSLFTFGAVLDNRKNKKRLAEISKDIEKLRKNIVNAKEKIEEKKSKIVIEAQKKSKNDEKKDPKKDPGIFKGIYNFGNFCYLHIALQNLYHNSSFRRKVLMYNTNTDEMKQVKNNIKNKDQKLINLVKILTPPEIDKDYIANDRRSGSGIETEQKRNAYRAILYATKFFFKRLNDHKDYSNLSNTQKDEFKKMAYFLGYDGEQRNSAMIQQRIEKACTYVIEHNEKPIILSDTDKKWLPFATEKYNEEKKKSPEILAKNAVENQLYLKHIYDENEDLRKKVLDLQDNDFYLDDYEKIKTIKTIFKMFEDNKFSPNKETFKLLDFIGRDQTLGGLRDEILRKIRKIAHSKKSKLLTRDSSIELKNIEKDLVSCIEIAINEALPKNNPQPYRLPLKDKKFTVTFSDRTGGSHEKFTAEEEIDLANLVDANKLVIFSDGKELDESNTRFRFKLVSATIGTGRHYYSYEKEGSTWHCLNDSTHEENVSWKKIQKTISEQCETLTYKLK
ncbi:MAG: hypothetical protein IJI84_00705 [Clostridia bacterium]|nr:hypothetical protein [Clostridia bacterium]